MSALAGVSGDVWLSISPPTALASPEACTDSGNHIFYNASVHQAWDPTAGITVQCSPNGTSGWTTVQDYVYYWPVGVIVFNSARVPGTNNFVRINQGSYFTISAFGGAHSWQMNMSGQTKDVTPFQAPGGWAVYASTIKNMTFSVDAYAADARILNEMITDPTPGAGKINVSNGIILCQLWHNESSGTRWQFYGLPTGVTQTVNATDIDTQNVTFQSNGPVYYVESNSFSPTTVIPM